MTRTELLYEIPTKSYFKRYLSVFNGNSLIRLTLSFSLMILVSAVYWKNTNISLNKPLFFGLIAIAFIYLIIVDPIRRCRKYITKINLVNDIITIEYFDSGEFKKISLIKNNLIYSSDNVDPEKSNWILFIDTTNKKNIVKQYGKLPHFSDSLKILNLN